MSVCDKAFFEREREREKRVASLVLSQNLLLPLFFFCHFFFAEKKKKKKSRKKRRWFDKKRPVGVASRGALFPQKSRIDGKVFAKILVLSKNDFSKKTFLKNF